MDYDIVTCGFAPEVQLTARWVYSVSTRSTFTSPGAPI